MNFKKGIMFLSLMVSVMFLHFCKLGSGGAISSIAESSLSALNIKANVSTKEMSALSCEVDLAVDSEQGFKSKSICGSEVDYKNIDCATSNNRDLICWQNNAFDVSSELAQKIKAAAVETVRIGGVKHLVPVLNEEVSICDQTSQGIAYCWIAGDISKKAREISSEDKVFLDLNLDLRQEASELAQ